MKVIFRQITGVFEKGFRRQVDEAELRFRREHRDLTPEIESRLVRLGNVLPPDEDESMNEWLDRLYELAR